ncbi:hypothetical protein MPER_05057 [Moniliophthora perniciosa FA553]|nr:hypothetical protein MPER_05057 [Moniliophthora perniciosa FA553]
MTMEELFKMRMEILPQLYIALGELSHARDLLSLILSSANSKPGSETNMSSLPIPSLRTQPQPGPNDPPQPSPSTLSATVITKPPSIIPLQAFNAQLVIGSKDEALRRASDIFKTAADRMERTRLRNERYWVDALKIRRGNWSLTPAPLPPGAPTGKGADKTTKDFVISYGLEEYICSFLIDKILVSGSALRLRIGKEQGTLPTASARVSERLIYIDAAQDTEFTFEIIDNKTFAFEAVNSIDQAKCDFIY